MALPRPDGGRDLTDPPKTISASTNIPGLQGVLDDPLKIGNYINQPADARLNSILKKRGSPLITGIIQQTDDSVGPNQAHPFACRFLFNPGEVTVSYSVAEGVTPPGDLTTDQLAAASIYAGQTGISFSLLFDRTYEVQYPPEPGRKDISSIGVYEDIAYLESVTGVRTSIKTSVTRTTADGSSKTETPTLLGNMLMIPVYIIFGGGDGAKTNQPIKGLSYVGFITSMTVSYALFSENMVPTRCGVQLSVQQLVGKDFNDFNAYGGTILNRDHSRSRSTTSSGAGLAGR